jgi:DNA-binding transcriptional ArsR family regulator
VALGHPIRVALLDLLARRGTVTATEAARELGESSGACSFHLRQLERYGQVEEAEVRRGRVRPWRLAVTPTAAPQAGSPEPQTDARAPQADLPAPPAEPAEPPAEPAEPPAEQAEPQTSPAAPQTSPAAPQTSPAAPKASRVPQGFPRGPGPETAAAPGDEFRDLARELENEGYRRWLAGRETAPPGWRDEAFSAVVYLTPGELTEVAAAIRAVIDSVSARRATPRPPEQAMPVGVVARMFPLLPASSDG